MAISFQSQISDFKIAEKKKITEWILLVAYLENKPVYDINYVFSDDEFLLNLNKQFLHHNTYTDILTFDYSSEKGISAEIYISVDRIKENAMRFKAAFDEEFRRVVIHGILHCIGYRDKTIRDRFLMRKKEDKYLQLFLQMN